MKTNQILSFDKLVDEYNHSYHHSIGKRPIDADFSSLAEKIQTNSKLPKFKFGDKVRITKHSNIYRKGYTRNWSKEIFAIESVLKSNLQTSKVTYSNRDDIMLSTYEKELYLSQL